MQQQKHTGTGSFLKLNFFCLFHLFLWENSYPGRLWPGYSPDYSNSAGTCAFLFGEHTESAASELFKSKCFCLLSSLKGIV